MVLNEANFDDALLSDVTDAFSKRQWFSCDNFQILSKGFPLVVIRNFLKEEFADSLKKAVDSLPFKHKSTDLFDFCQSPDLKPFKDDTDDPIGLICREIFSPKFADSISTVINKPLGTHIDFAAQRYCNGQYLLCHDDRLESRRVAFVLYLVDPTWKEEDGGQFEKYGLEWDGSATVEPVESFTPSWNTLVFFEVSMWSHHQVAEVIGSLPRLSVAGWLHDLPTESNDSKWKGSISLSPALLEDLRKSFQTAKSKTITTKHSHFKHILLDDNSPALLELLGVSNGPFDYPTWPTCIEMEADRSFTFPDHTDNRVLFILVLKGSIQLGDGSLTVGDLKSLQLTPDLTILSDAEQSTLIYWTVQLK